VLPTKPIQTKKEASLERRRHKGLSQSVNEKGENGNKTREVLWRQRRTNNNPAGVIPNAGLLRGRMTRKDHGGRAMAVERRREKSRGAKTKRIATSHRSRGGLSTTGRVFAGGPPGREKRQKPGSFIKNVRWLLQRKGGRREGTVSMRSEQILRNWLLPRQKDAERTEKKKDSAREEILQLREGE